MKFCPHCGEDLSVYIAAESSGIVPQISVGKSVSVQRNYDQTKTWKGLISRAQEVWSNPPDITQLALSAASGLKNHLKNGKLSTIIHLVFSENVVPQGGVLYQATMLNGKTGNSEDQLRSLGYCVENGKVELVDDIAVGPAYGVLNYWGGERQYRRWHLEGPVEINPSRHGDKYFMDDNMVAFGAVWNDGDRVEEGLIELLELFNHGVGGENPVARPIALEVVAEA